MQGRSRGLRSQWADERGESRRAGQKLNERSGQTRHVGLRRRRFQIRTSHVTGMLLARLRLRLARFSMPADHRDVSSWSSARVRSEFFSFFREKNHSFVPSSSTIPYEDPTLLFANAGMNQVCRLFRSSLALDNILVSSSQFSWATLIPTRV